MPPDRAEQVQAWLEHAGTDLRAARADLGVEPPIVGDALFHAQQAVEKALKGYLVARDVAFRATHDLRELSGLVLPLAPTLEPLLKKAVRLGPFAVTFRQPRRAAASSSSCVIGTNSVWLRVPMTISSQGPAI